MHQSSIFRVVGVLCAVSYTAAKYKWIFTALHAMQTRYNDENSVRPSVRLSHACIVRKRKKGLSRFLYHTKDILA